MKMKLSHILFLIAIISLGLLVYISYSTNYAINLLSRAASGSKQLTSKAEWESGVNINTITNSPDGDVKINLGSGVLDILSQYNSDNSRLTATTDEVNKTNVIDSNVATAWTVSCVGVSCGATGDWVFNLDNTYIISRFRVQRNIILGGGYIYTSTNGVDYTLRVTTMGPLSDGWQTYNLAPAVEATYIKITVAGGGGPGAWSGTLNELEITSTTPSATHTSAAQQIDGTSTLQSWDSFTATETDHDQNSGNASTKIEYQFRTGDGTAGDSGWSAWTAKQEYSGTNINLGSSGLNLTADATHRYAQVKSTLTTTNASYTPTLSSYTVNYSRDDTCDGFDRVSISPTTASLTTGASTSLSALAINSGGSSMIGPTFSWSASAGSISGTGSSVTYTAPATAGTYTVTVTSSCGGSSSATITVTAPNTTVSCDNFDKLTISPGAVTLKREQTVTFSVLSYNKDGSTNSNPVYFSYSGGSMLGDGTYTAGLSVGTFTVTAISACGGTANATVVINLIGSGTPPPNEPEVTDPTPCAPGPPYFNNCADITMAAKLLAPNGGEQYQLTDSIPISFKASGGYTEYLRLNGKELVKNPNFQLDAYISVNEGLYFKRILKDIDYTKDFQIIESDPDFNNRRSIKINTSYTIPIDFSYVTNTARIVVRSRLEGDSPSELIFPDPTASTQGVSTILFSYDGSDKNFSIGSGDYICTGDSCLICKQAPCFVCENNQCGNGGGGTGGGGGGGTCTETFCPICLDQNNCPQISKLVYGLTILSPKSKDIWYLGSDQTPRWHLTLKLQDTRYKIQTITNNQDTRNPSTSSGPLQGNNQTITNNQIQNSNQSVGKQDTTPISSLSPDALTKVSENLNNLSYNLYLSTNNGADNYPIVLFTDLSLKDHFDPDKEFSHITLGTDPALVTKEAKVRLVIKNRLSGHDVTEATSDTFEIKNHTLVGGIIDTFRNYLDQIAKYLLLLAGLFAFLINLMPFLANALSFTGFGDMLSGLLLRLANFFGLVLFGFHKKRLRGIVYDSSTIEPVPNAQVLLLKVEEGSFGQGTRYKVQDTNNNPTFAEATAGRQYPNSNTQTNPNNQTQTQSVDSRHSTVAHGLSGIEDLRGNDTRGEGNGLTANVSASQLQTSDSQLQTSGIKLPPSDSHLQTSGIKLPPSDSITAGSAKLISVTVTGNDGRFQIALEPGKYQLLVKKTGFRFPSQVINEREFNYLDNNYFGEVFEVSDFSSEKDLDFNLPIDYIAEQYQQARVRSVIRVNFLEKFLILSNYPLLALGTFISVLAAYITPNLFNITILILYIPLWLFGVRQTFRIKTWGSVIDELNGQPVQLALVRAYALTSKFKVESSKLKVEPAQNQPVDQIGDNKQAQNQQVNDSQVRDDSPSSTLETFNFTNFQLGRLKRTVVTNEKGKFLLRLEPGKFNIAASKVNYQEYKPLRVRLFNKLDFINLIIKLKSKNNSNSKPITFVR